MHSRLRLAQHRRAPRPSPHVLGPGRAPADRARRLGILTPIPLREMSSQSGASVRGPHCGDMLFVTVEKLPDPCGSGDKPNVRTGKRPIIWTEA